MKQFTKQNLPDVRKQIDAALAKVAVELGIRLEIKNISFSEGEFRTQLTGTVLGYQNPMATGLYGYEPVSTKFMYNNQEWEVIGHNLKKRKFPIIAENKTTGQKANFPNDSVTLRKIKTTS